MRRRRFLKLLGTATAASGWRSFASARAVAAILPSTPIEGRRVAIFGGGVAGMSVAHELAERGFEVTIYEARDVAGGKARSMGAPGTGQGGRKDLPGEHGFRFFPAFYRHLPDTMKRIPFGGNRLGVFDNLVPASRILLSRAGQADVMLDGRFPSSFDDVRTLLEFVFDSRLGVPRDELEHFARCLEIFLTSCDERRLEEYERITWWDFVGAGERSEAYQKYLATGLCRSLVAMKPRTASTRTIGTILWQLLQSFGEPGAQPDRLLNGPTSDVWIQPWLRHLSAAGVRFAPECPLQSLRCSEDGLVAGATILDGGVRRGVEADLYVCAMPVEATCRVVGASDPRLTRLEPRLERIAMLQTEWMNGIQYFLNEDSPLADGHVIYIDSPWALTSISQRQFWRPVDLEGYGDGNVRGILSVDISDWGTPGVLYGKPARECTREEIRSEVWEQIKRHVNDDGVTRLLDSQLVDWFLDPAIVFNASGETENREPLLVNTVGSWVDRPEAVTRIPNLFLAADYIRTTSDLACMESANEAARRAVNGILDVTASTASRCALWALDEPAAFWPAKQFDKLRFRLGLGHLG